MNGVHLTCYAADSAEDETLIGLRWPEEGNVDQPISSTRPLR